MRGHFNKTMTMGSISSKEFQFYIFCETYDNTVSMFKEKGIFTFKQISEYYIGRIKILFFEMKSKVLH